MVRSVDVPEEQHLAVEPRRPERAATDRRWAAFIAIAAALLLASNLAVLIAMGSVVLDEGIPDEIDYLHNAVSETARTFGAVAAWGQLYVPVLAGISIGFGVFASRSDSRRARISGICCVLLAVALFLGNALMGTLWWSFGS